MTVQATFDLEWQRVTLTDGEDSVTVSRREFDNASHAIIGDPQFNKEYSVFKLRFLLNRFREQQEATDGLA